MAPATDDRPLIATSLVPGRTDRVQSDAVSSWLALDLRVISVNAAPEIAALKAAHPDIEFVAAERTGQKIAGKPVPMIVDMMRAAVARRGTARAIGVINADIVLRPVPGLFDVINAEIADSLILLPRVDVAATADYRPGGPTNFSIGYDGFFIDAGLVAAIPDSPFCLGMPFWDYWLPMIAILQQRALKTIASPVALHVTHDTKWDQAIYFYFHALVGDLIAVSRTGVYNALLPDVFANVYARIFDLGTAADATAAQRQALADVFDRIQEVVVHHIKQRAKPLTVPGA